MTPDSVVVRWRTDQNCKSVVMYGTSLDQMTNRASAAGEFTEHVVYLTNLRPDTRYYYYVGTAPDRFLAGGTFDYSFVTYPKPGPVRPFRFGPWVTPEPPTRINVRFAMPSPRFPRIFPPPFG
jgi:hypothetical protein